MFICYASANRRAAVNLAQALKEKGILPWIDVWEVPPGTPWQRAVEAQLERVKAVAVLVGRGKDGQSVGPWQREELEAFLQEYVKRGCTVIPVLLRGAKKVKLPVFMGNRTWVEFGKDPEEGLEQLAWGITGRRPGSEPY